jgi:transcriptional regulator with XRE-family HTH domain
VVNSDLLIVLSHHPSFGAGQELDFAHNAMVPIIVIVPSGKKLSRMVGGIPGLVIQVDYMEPEDLRIELNRQLEIIRPLLVQRKLQFAKHDVNVVGDRIRLVREASRLTRAELAQASSEEAPITESMLAHWEESSDRESNLSLIQLREIAVLLNVSVAELVEPNLDAMYLSFVNSLLESADEKVAARWGAYSNEDRKRIVLRLLERFGIELGVDNRQ